MKMMRRFLFGGIALLLLLCGSGCNEPAGQVSDNQAADSAQVQAPDQPNPPASDTASQASAVGTDTAKAQVPAHSTATLFPPESTFSQHFTNLQNALFETAYDPDEMAEHEKKPFFSNSRHRMFQRMRIKKPIGSTAGSRIYPRHILKGYQFGTADEALKTVTKWLNDFEHSGDSISLGQSVKAIKSPPVLVAIRENEVFMLQTACMYTIGDWQRIRDAFLGMKQESTVQYVFTIGCNAGELTYQKP